MNKTSKTTAITIFIKHQQRDDSMHHCDQHGAASKNMFYTNTTSTSTFYFTFIS